MGINALSQVSPLLTIGEPGEQDANKAVSLMLYGEPVTVADASVAAAVLRHFGCDEEYITRKINYALTGEWPEDLIG